MGRITGLDFARGVAVLIMVVDHIAGILLYENISFLEIRFATRIAEPMFALLFGYFMANYFNSTTKALMRLIYLFSGVAFVNVFYYALFSNFEILTTLLLCFVIGMIVREKLKYFFVILMFFPIDPTRGLLSYPLSIVLSQVAVGSLMRERNITSKELILLCCFYLFSLFLIEFSFYFNGYTIPLHYTVLFTPLAIVIVNSLKHVSVKIEPINFIGIHAYEIYFIQYIIISMIKLSIDVFSGAMNR